MRSTVKCIGQGMTFSTKFPLGIAQVKPYFVTTPIFYVNSTPHLGHLYTVVIADAAQRFVKLNNPVSCLLTTGTDEHGLKIQECAKLACRSPLEFCNMIAPSFKSLFDASLIQYSDFIRTTESRHIKAVEEFFKAINDNGYIYKDLYEGWYCIADETFITEKQLNKQTLMDGTVIQTSEESGNVVEWSSEVNYIFKLSAFQKELLYWLKDDGRVVPSRFQEELKLWISHGLSDLSISRPKSRVSWGIQLPCDTDHTIYVWLDALVNYLTAVGYPEYSYWPPDLQVIGKDILRFHGIYWPALLIAAGLEPPRKLLVHSHWQVDGLKMSKSRGNIICPFNLVNKFTPDGIRYLLLRMGTPHSDNSWNSAKAIEYINAELANTLGNLVNRCTPKSLNPEQVFPMIDKQNLEHSSSDTCKLLIEQINGLADAVKGNYLDFNYYLGIESIMKMLRAANGFIDEEKPWKIKDNRIHLDFILYLGLTAAKAAGIALQPIIPSIACSLLNYLGVDKRSWIDLENPFVYSEQLNLGEKNIVFNRIKC